MGCSAVAEMVQWFTGFSRQHLGDIFPFGDLFIGVKGSMGGKKVEKGALDLT